MSVNKYIIKLPSTRRAGNSLSVARQEDSKFIKIPIQLDFNSTDQAEVVQKDFISKEVEESINPIVDYEQVRFTPKLTNGDLLSTLRFKLNFLNSSGSYVTPTTYADIGFTDEDMKFQKNRFKNSFMTLKFYDSDKPTNQNLVMLMTVFSRLHYNDFNPLVDGLGNPLLGGGLPKNANEIPVRFNIDDPIRNPEGFAEGFYIYYYKSFVETRREARGLAPKNLYMRAEFNNAATGKITRFITTSDLLSINDVIEKLHVKYLLSRDATGHYYTISTTYANATNITESTDSVTIDLYEIRVE